MNFPEYAKIDGKKYKINTDFKTAIECNRIAQDESIGDLERALAIIYKLFGEEGINTPDHYEKLLEMAKKYLLRGEEYDTEANEKPDMDFIEDYSYITTSFMSDYNIDLDNTEMHWWKFIDLMNGLSYSELGDCCILNRIRNLRNMDLNEIKDQKERDKIRKAQERVALKKKEINVELTPEQQESVDEFYKALGL